MNGVTAISRERGHRFWRVTKTSVNVRPHVCCRNAVDACQLGVRHAVRHRWGFPGRERTALDLVSWVTNAATGRPIYGDRFHTGNIEQALTCTWVPVRLTTRRPRRRLERRAHRRDAARWHSGVLRRRRRSEGRWWRRVPAAVHHHMFLPMPADQPMPPTSRRPGRVDGPAGPDAAGTADGTATADAARTADGTASDAPDPMMAPPPPLDPMMAPPPPPVVRSRRRLRRSILRHRRLLPACRRRPGCRRPDLEGAITSAA